MRILVIGGTRFIGHATVQALARRGHDLLLVNRGRTQPPTPLPHAGLEQLRADHDALPSARADLARWAPEVALDMVASCQRQADTLVNALEGIVQRVVAISSVDVYRACQRFYGLGDGGTGGDDHEDAINDAPLGEQAALRTALYPRRQWSDGPDDWRYHYDKLPVERTLAAAFDTTVLRLPFVYGPGDYRRRVAGALQTLRGAPGGVVTLEPGQGRWRCTRGYVGDVAAAIADALLDPRARGRTYNLGEPSARAHTQWLRDVARAARLPEPRFSEARATQSTSLHWRHHLEVDTARLRRELDFDEPVGAAEGLRRAVAAAR